MQILYSITKHRWVECFFLDKLQNVFNADSLPSIGAIFVEEERDGPTELAFKYVVYRINKDRNILPNATLLYDIQYVSRDDSFHAVKRGKFD